MERTLQFDTFRVSNYVIPGKSYLFFQHLVIGGLFIDSDIFL